MHRLNLTDIDGTHIQSSIKILCLAAKKLRSVDVGVFCFLVMQSLMKRECMLTAPLIRSIPLLQLNVLCYVI
jgi:hypothetical protein